MEEKNDKLVVSNEKFKGSEVNKILMKVKYTFNQEELLELAEDLSNAISDTNHLEEKKKEAVAAMNQKISEKKAEAQYLSTLVGQKYELRQIPVYKVTRRELGLIQYYAEEQDPTVDDPIKEERIKNRIDQISLD